MNFYTLALAALEPASFHKSVSAQKLSKGSKFNGKNAYFKMYYDVHIDIGGVCWRRCRRLISDVGDSIDRICH